MRAGEEGEVYVHMVHICMHVYVKARDQPLVIPQNHQSPFCFYFILLFCFLFCVRISRGLGFPEQARQIGQPQGSAFLCHTWAKVYKYAPPLGLFRWVLGIEPQLSGLHKEHFAN